MDEATGSMTNMAMNNDRYAGDDRVHARFYMHPKMNQTKTKEAGRPIYEEVPYIEILTPGNKENMFKQPANDLHKQRFARQWRQFQENIEQESVMGTPLSEWPQMTRAQVEELRHFNIRTVEQLAELADSNSQGMMGIQGMKQAAKEWLESSNSKDAKLEEAQKMIQDMQKRLQELESAKEEKPKRRGRPPKVEAEDSEE
jgi:hypothetical protein